MVAAYSRTLRSAHRNVRFLFTISAIMSFTIDGGIYSVIFNLYILRLGFGPELVGLVNSVANLVFAFGSLAAGWLGGFWGSRRTMIAGVSVTLLGSLALPLADTVPADWRAAWLIVTYLVAYSGLSLYYVNSGPFMMRVTPSGARGNIFAMQSAVNASASFAGGLVGGLLPAVVASILGVSLMEPAPYRIPLILVGVLMGIALLVVLQTREPEDGELVDVRLSAGGAPATAGAFGLISFMAVVRFLQVSGVGACVTFFNVYMDKDLGVATAQIGIISATARLISVPAALLGPVLSRRFGFGATAVMGSLGAFSSLLPLALVPVPLVGGLGYIGLQSFTSMRYPAFYVYIMERTPDRLRATMNGVQEMAAGLSFSLISFAGGFIIVNYGYTAMFLAGATLTLAGTLLFAVFVRLRGETVGEPSGH